MDCYVGCTISDCTFTYLSYCNWSLQCKGASLSALYTAMAAEVFSSMWHSFSFQNQSILTSYNKTKEARAAAKPHMAPIRKTNDSPASSATFPVYNVSISCATTQNKFLWLSNSSTASDTQAVRKRVGFATRNKMKGKGNACFENIWKNFDLHNAEVTREVFGIPLNNNGNGDSLRHNERHRA